MKIRLELILGIVLFLAAFAVLYFLANVINPPAINVLVAVRDITAGETLTVNMARLEEVSLPDPSLVITEEEVSRFSGAIAVEDIHQGELLQMVSFVLPDHPAAPMYTSLGLDDPAMAAFVIPVDISTAPSDIRRGDLVDVIMGIGGENQMTGEFLSGTVSQESSSWTEVETVPLVTPDSDDEETSSLQEEGGEDNTPWFADPSEFYPQDSSPHAVEREKSIEVLLPIAKVLVRCARVLDVVYEESTSSTYDTSVNGETVHGDLSALVLMVPIESQELLTFALSNGDVRVGLRSPLAGTDHTPTLGMSWGDLAEFFSYERELRLQQSLLDSNDLNTGVSLIDAIMEAYEKPTTSAEPSAGEFDSSDESIPGRE
jgi:Flp pilus assembly protein CpaB